MDETTLERRLTRLEEAIDYIGEDIEEIKDTHLKIENLAMSVNTLASEVKHLVENNTAANINAERNNDRVCAQMKELSGRISNLEQKPGKRWESLIGTIIGLLAGYIARIVFGG